MLLRTRPITTLDPLLHTTRDVDRLLETLMPALRGFAPTPDLPSALAPPMNLTEDEAAYHLQLDLPGVSLDEVEVLATPDSVTVRGERTAETTEDGSVQHARERFVGAYERSLTLPTEIDPDAVEANLSQGVLRVSLPKANTGRRSRKVPVISANDEHPVGARS